MKNTLDKGCIRIGPRLPPFGGKRPGPMFRGWQVQWRKIQTRHYVESGPGASAALSCLNMSLCRLHLGVSRQSIQAGCFPSHRHRENVEALGCINKRKRPPVGAGACQKFLNSGAHQVVAVASTIRLTRVAFSPLGLSSHSYSTDSPSCRVLNP